MDQEAPASQEDTKIIEKANPFKSISIPARASVEEVHRVLCEFRTLLREANLHDLRSRGSQPLKNAHLDSDQLMAPESPCQATTQGTQGEFVKKKVFTSFELGSVAGIPGSLLEILRSSSNSGGNYGGNFNAGQDSNTASEDGDNHSNANSMEYNNTNVNIWLLMNVFRKVKDFSRLTSFLHETIDLG